MRGMASLGASYYRMHKIRIPLRESRDKRSDYGAGRRGHPFGEFRCTRGGGWGVHSGTTPSPSSTLRKNGDENEQEKCCAYWCAFGLGSHLGDSLCGGE